MKTSNKLLVSATLIIICYLVAYNFALKAEYLKGDYKNRFYHMQHIKISDFNAVEHNIGNFTDVTIEEGPEFGVWVNDRLKDEIGFTERNKTLYINYTGKNDYPGRYFESSVVVTCPVINSVITRPFKTAVTWSRAETRITGFKQDAELNINSNSMTEIILYKNSFNKLTAQTGESKAIITIHGDNSIKDADFKILGHSELKLFNPTIDKSNFNYTDSATMTLSGRALHLVQTN